MPAKVTYEPAAEKAKRDCDKVKDKLKNLSKDELGDLLAAIFVRLDELEK